MSLKEEEVRRGATCLCRMEPPYASGTVDIFIIERNVQKEVSVARRRCQPIKAQKNPFLIKSRTDRAWYQKHQVVCLFVFVGSPVPALGLFLLSPGPFQIFLSGLLTLREVLLHQLLLSVPKLNFPRNLPKPKHHILANVKIIMQN